MTIFRNLKCLLDGVPERRQPCRVFFTADDRAETLSIAAPKQHRMVTINFAEINRMVERERKKKYKAKTGHYIIDETPEYIPIEWLQEYMHSIETNMTPAQIADQIVADWERECQEEFEKACNEEAVTNE